MYDIPLPKVVADVEAGGPFVTAARGLNSLKKLQAEAQYAPYTEYANALSKTAYAQTAPALALATFMSGPAAANLTRDQAQALASQMQNYLQRSNMTSNLPPPNTSLGGNSLAGNVIEKLVNHLSGKVMPQPVNQVNQMPVSQQMPQQASGTGLDVAPPLDANGRIPITPPPGFKPPVTGTAGLPFNRQAGALPLPGTQGGFTPVAGASAQQAGLIKGTEEEIAAQSKMWTDMHEKSALAAINSQKVDDLADEFSDAYDLTNKWEKGPITGSIPPLFSAAADTADRSSNGMADAVARAQQEGHITARDRDTYLNMKPSRSMRPETKENAVAFVHGANQRTRENAAFNVAAQKFGLTPQEANIVWLHYIQKNPFYSAKEHKLIPENFNKWPQYLTNEKIQEALNPSSGQQPVTAPSTPSRGAKILSSGLKIPKFNTKEEGIAWFNRQPKITQDAIRMHLGSK